MNKLTYFLAFMAWFFLPQAASHAAERLDLNQAKFVLSTNTMPPSFSHSEMVGLPHKHTEKVDVSGWYHLTFNAQYFNPIQSESIQSVPSDSKHLAVYLPSVNMNAELFLNGQRLGSGGSMTPSVARNWHRPLIFTIPQVMLQTENNTLAIHVVSASPGRFIHLGKVVVGDETTLQNAYSVLYFEKQTYYKITLALSIIVGLIMLYLFYLRRQADYLWFAVTCFIWGVASTDIVITNLPVATYVWQASILWLIGWMPVSLTLFLYSFMSVQLNKFGKFVVSYGLLLFILLWLVPIDSIFSFILIWFSLTMILGGHTIILLYQHRKRLIQKNKTMFILLFGSICLCYILAIHDFLYVTEMIDVSSRVWLGFAIPLLLIAIALLLVRQFAKAMLDIENINLTLQEQIKDAKAEIKESYAIISAMEAEEAVDKERSRIFGDLHDDLGAKLLSLVYKSETDEQKTLAKQAMQGLREIVKQSPVYTNQFAAPLLAWRTECQQRALEHQAQLQWHQAYITDAYQLPEKINLQLSMVLREALSNALKHGDGKNINIRIQLRFGHLLMSVHNQGNRFIANHTDGNGRHNMQQRIQNIGGRIRWRANKHGGCHVAWAVPLQGGLND